MSIKKCILLILDGLGVGELPDALKYGDVGSNTIKSISFAKNLNIQNLLSLGFGNISSIENVVYNGPVIGCFGKMEEISKGKDSTIGHWEIAGLVTKKPFPVFPSGFSDELMQKFLRFTELKGYLGNLVASGTEIINQLGAKHIETGFPIVYTSADSVFQIASHEEVITLERLYEICQIARNEIFIDDFAVARVIARPFLGNLGGFQRTANRRDYSLKPPKKTLIDYLSDSGLNTVGIGKIDDLFAGQGLNEKIHTKSNLEGIVETIKLSRDRSNDFIFVNLVDFDMLFGHRNDALGYATALEYFDTQLPEILKSLNEEDLLIITSDHGNDPGDSSTDHTREYVPLLTFSHKGKKGIDIGVRKTFADVSKTILEFYGVESKLEGVSFLTHIF